MGLKEDYYRLVSGKLSYVRQVPQIKPLVSAE
jgi:hypothetical protein